MKPDNKEIHAEISVEVRGKDEPEKIHFFNMIAIISFAVSLVLAALFLVLGNIMLLIISTWSVIVAGVAWCINAILHTGESTDIKPNSPVYGIFPND